MAINFNPNLPPNDSLEPWQIKAKIAARNQETIELTEKAYLAAGVPVSAAENAADHASVKRETPQAKKAFKDADTWHRAKRNQHYQESYDYEDE